MPVSTGPVSTGPAAALLLLADGRMPTGSHAHSGGLEAAVQAGRVRDAGDLAAWLAGRLATVGRVDAAFAAVAWAAAGTDFGITRKRWGVLDAELSARVAPPAWRAASRAQGRGLVRAAHRCWPSAPLDALAAALPAGAPWPLALGVAGRAAGLGAGDVTLAAGAAAVQGPAWAATRLLGLDPYAVAACLAGLAPAIDREAAAARRWADPGVDARLLPAASAPWLDIGAADHGTWEVRLFAS
ncbi:MAG TPA: urease accessory UreF family protein [Acidimicrobiales bacterium]|jgi:urease accessory protein